MGKKECAAYGGQAVLEGVMMQGAGGKAISCRRSDGVVIYKTERLPSLTARYPFLKWPLVRGCYSFAMSLSNGLKDIGWSAAQSGGEEEAMSGKDIALAVFLAAILTVAIFIVLPVFAGVLVLKYVGPFGRSLTEGLLRIILFVAYILLIGRMPDIKRLFAYHGAEHKTINAYEEGEELLPAKIREHSRIHTRCGTSFLLMSMLLMIVIFTFVGQTTAFYRILIKLAMLPVVAGVAYELFRLPLKFPRSRLVCALVAPGLALQRLTTREPDDEMIAVAVNSLIHVPGFVPSYHGEPSGVLAMEILREGENPAPGSLAEKAAEETKPGSEDHERAEVS